MMRSAHYKSGAGLFSYQSTPFGNGSAPVRTSSSIELLRPYLSTDVWITSQNKGMQKRPFPVFFSPLCPIRYHRGILAKKGLYVKGRAL